MSSLSSALSSLLSSNSSSSGIDISSLLEALDGQSTPGIDVTSAVNAAVQAAEKPEDTWLAQEQILQSQQSALSGIQSDTQAVVTDLTSLNSLTGALNNSNVTSSDSAVVTASAGTNATEGTDVVVVNSLASTASYSSSAVASATTDLPTGETITITPSTGSAVSFTSGANGVDSLTDLENAINSSGAGVTASIVTDSSGSRLAIESNTSGSAGNFTVTGSDSGFGFTAGATGANASLTVNGIQVSSASNTVTNVVPGVTLNLQSASPGTQVTLNVTPATSGVYSSIDQFVSDYNTLVGALNTQFTYTSGEGEGVEAQDSTVQTLQNTVEGALGYTSTTGTGSSAVTTSLASLGINVNKDGTLTVDASTLDSVVANNYSSVQNFFQGSALNGFAAAMNSSLKTYTEDASGAFSVDLSSMSTQYSALQTDIANFQANVITPLQAQLTAEYSTAEEELQQMPTKIKDVDAELGINQGSSNG